MLAEKFEGKFTCLGENTKKYITFSVPIEKEVTRMGKKEKKSQKSNLPDYNLLKVPDFKARSISNLANNLAEGIHKIKCKNEHENKKCKTCGINYEDCNCFLEYTIFKDNSIEYKCLCCNKNYQKKV